MEQSLYPQPSEPEGETGWGFVVVVVVVVVGPWGVVVVHTNSKQNENVIRDDGS
jgi:hypothetical protein